MPKVTLNGWEINYEEAGAGPPIILIHGFLMDHTMLAPQVEALKSRYRVVTPDLRGHGESEKRAEPHTQWDLMEDHIALLDHLGIEKAIWGGVSQGGFQSLRAALKHPERVKALILIETQAGGEDEVRRPMYEAMSDFVASEGWTDDILQTATISMFGDSAPEDLKKHWVERWRAQPTFASREQMRAVSERDDITDRLGEITAPAIVIHGEEEAAIDMERAEELARGLQGLIEFVRIPGAGHSSTVERPEAVNEAVVRFLDNLEGEGGQS